MTDKNYDARLSAIKKIEDLAMADGRTADNLASMGLNKAASDKLECARFLVLAATHLKNMK